MCTIKNLVIECKGFEFYFSNLIFRNEIIDRTKMGSMECRANVLVLFITMKPTIEKKLFKEQCHHHCLDLQYMIKIQLLLFTFENLSHSINPCCEGERSGEAITQFMIEYNPRERTCETGNHWKIPKFHIVFNIQQYMKLFRSATTLMWGLKNTTCEMFGTPYPLQLKRLVRTQREISRWVPKFSFSHRTVE